MRDSYICLVSWHRGTKRHKDPLCSLPLPNPIDFRMVFCQFSLRCYFPEREREEEDPPSQNKKETNKSPAISFSVGDWVPFLPTGSARDLLPVSESLWLMLLLVSGTNFHFSGHSMIQTKNFRGRKIMDSADF